MEHDHPWLCARALSLFSKQKQSGYVSQSNIADVNLSSQIITCSISHTDDEIQALVQKLIDEDIVRQKAIMDLALQFDNACTAKDDLRKTYEKCNDIPQESRALIDTFLKEESDKDYEMNLFMYGNATKIERQMNAKLVWLREKYNYCSQTHMGGSSSQTHEIGDVYLTKKELHQLHLDK
ncbi:hypothetical protein Tco_1324947 [Tanacetum coccineum]